MCACVLGDELFGKNERDTVSATWPSEWANPSDELISQCYDQWGNKVGCPAGVHQQEPLWTYFEVGQVYNCLLLDQGECD